eukprot:7206690-Pyramimonas_sp.AAC.1
MAILKARPLYYSRQVPFRSRSSPQGPPAAALRGCAPRDSRALAAKRAPRPRTAPPPPRRCGSGSGSPAARSCAPPVRRASPIS